VSAARRAGIDRLIITDHNTIRGALEARKLDPELVIVGEEIMTTRGELLAAFVVEELPARLEPVEAIRRLKEQGAFISVSHPFDHFRAGHWERSDLLEILPLVDAIEVFNARCLDMRPNLEAQEFARLYDLAGTVGSDAHTTREIGRASLALDEFADADGLRAVIRSGRESLQLSSPFIHLSSRFASTMKSWGLAQRPDLFE
jgi:hypothetical protein